MHVPEETIEATLDSPGQLRLAHQPRLPRGPVRVTNRVAKDGPQRARPRSPGTTLTTGGALRMIWRLRGEEKGSGTDITNRHYLCPFLTFFVLPFSSWGADQLRSIQLVSNSQIDDFRMLVKRRDRR
jgi:hypothetical protein